MKYIELSRKDLEEQCNHWANEIKNLINQILLYMLQKRDI